jgi:putative transcriptional regulator
MSRQGKLLIAHPNLPRNNPFYKSVIYIFNDNSHGTQGIILNKPADLSVHEFLLTKRFDGFPETSAKMRFGGPLSTKTVYMIHTDDFESTSSAIAGKGLMLSSDDFMFEKMSYGQQPSAWRVAIGVCGWQPGQLDLELKGQRPYKSENSWLTAEGNDSIIFNYDGEEQWKNAMNLSSVQMINQFF